MSRAIVALACVAMLVPGPAAAAHEEEFPAKTLVHQAIALLRTQPEQHEVIEDKIHDALESESPEGVDLSLVQQADEAFEAGNMHEAWDLLELSIGAPPHRVVTEPGAGPGTPAPAAVLASPSPSPLHEVALDRELGAPRGAAGWILLGAAAAVALAGLLVVAKVR